MLVTGAVIRTIGAFDGSFSRPDRIERIRRYAFVILRCVKQQFRNEKRLRNRRHVSSDLPALSRPQGQAFMPGARPNDLRGLLRNEAARRDRVSCIVCVPVLCEDTSSGCDPAAAGPRSAVHGPSSRRPDGGSASSADLLPGGHRQRRRRGGAGAHRSGRGGSSLDSRARRSKRRAKGSSISIRRVRYPRSAWLMRSTEPSKRLRPARDRGGAGSSGMPPSRCGRLRQARRMPRRDFPGTTHRSSYGWSRGFSAPLVRLSRRNLP